MPKFVLIFLGFALFALLSLNYNLCPTLKERGAFKKFGMPLISYINEILDMQFLPMEES